MDESSRRGSLLVVFLTVFIDLLGFAIVLPLLPIYAEQYSVDPHGLQLGLLMASFSAMQFLFAPVWGRISDRVGRRPVILIGLAGSVLFYTLFGLAATWRSLSWLFLSRIGAGVVGATISTAQAYIADTTTLENRQKGMALIGMAFGLGFAVGPLVGCAAVLVGRGDPGALPGYVAAGLSAIALGLAWFLLPESLATAGEREHRDWWDPAAWRVALTTRSILPLLATSFICVFSFADFETTIALLVKGQTDAPFQFSFAQVFLTFAYIGFILALVQGFILRRLAGRVAEDRLATSGAVIQIVGFGLLVTAINREQVVLLVIALGLVVTGFGLLYPSLNSLISRRTDPTRQGRVLGVAQSVSSLARIVGAGVGIPLLKVGLRMPFYTAAALMAAGLAMVLLAARSGSDFRRAD